MYLILPLGSFILLLVIIFVVKLFIAMSIIVLVSLLLPYWIVGGIIGLIIGLIDIATAKVPEDSVIWRWIFIGIIYSTFIAIFFVWLDLPLNNITWGAIIGAIVVDIAVLRGIILDKEFDSDGERDLSGIVLFMTFISIIGAIYGAIISLLIPVLAKIDYSL